MFKHKGIRRDSKKLHEHASHPYPHPEGRLHRFGPRSRIKDRKGKKFRGKNERSNKNVSGSYRPRKGGKKKQWD